MSSQVCIDVNLALKLVLAEHDSPKAHHLWSAWVEADVGIVAPPRATLPLLRRPGDEPVPLAGSAPLG